MDILLQQLINGLVLGSIYALVALGYTMVYGILGLINFAHGDICMIGALVALTLAQALAASGMPAPFILVIATGGAVAVCVALGVSFERVAYRPLRRAPRRDYAGPRVASRRRNRRNAPWRVPSEHGAGQDRRR